MGVSVQCGEGPSSAGRVCPVWGGSDQCRGAYSGGGIQWGASSGEASSAGVYPGRGRASSGGALEESGLWSLWKLRSQRVESRGMSGRQVPLETCLRQTVGSGCHHRDSATSSGEDPSRAHATDPATPPSCGRPRGASPAAATPVTQHLSPSLTRAPGPLHRPLKVLIPKGEKERPPTPHRTTADLGAVRPGSSPRTVFLPQSVPRGR